LRAIHKRTLIAVLAAGALGFVPDSRPATAPAKKPAPAKRGVAKSSIARESAVNSPATRTSRRSSSKPRRMQSQSFRYRLARLKLQPERISEIQGALARAGYLNQEPNGRWDEPTRAAMLRFQQEHGFPDTGLPEAKSLMKLGLGPHPLPQELDSTAQASQPASPLPAAEGADPSSADAPSRNPQQ
jgi:peptidoglycan hydrolase-like protein with peptidoglycan-binding domain